VNRKPRPVAAALAVPLAVPPPPTAHTLRAAPRLGDSRAPTAHTPQVAPSVGDSRAPTAHTPQVAPWVGDSPPSNRPLTADFFAGAELTSPGGVNRPLVGSKALPAGRSSSLQRVDRPLSSPRAREWAIHRHSTAHAPRAARRMGDSRAPTAHAPRAAPRVGDSPPRTAHSVELTLPGQAISRVARFRTGRSGKRAAPAARSRPTLRS